MKSPDRRCSFCGKREEDVRRLVAGGDPRGVFICNECIALLNSESFKESGTQQR